MSHYRAHEELEKSKERKADALNKAEKASGKRAASEIKNKTKTEISKLKKLQSAAKLDKKSSRQDSERIIKSAKKAEKVTKKASEATSMKKAEHAKEIQEVGKQNAAAQAQVDIVKAQIDKKAQEQKDQVKREHEFVKK